MDMSVVMGPPLSVIITWSHHDTKRQINKQLRAAAGDLEGKGAKPPHVLLPREDLLPTYVDRFIVSVSLSVCVCWLRVYTYESADATLPTAFLSHITDLNPRHTHRDTPVLLLFKRGGSLAVPDMAARLLHPHPNPNPPSSPTNAHTDDKGAGHDGEGGGGGGAPVAVRLRIYEPWCVFILLAITSTTYLIYLTTVPTTTHTHRIAHDAQALVRQLLLLRQPPTASDDDNDNDDVRGGGDGVRHVVLCTGLHESLDGVLPPVVAPAGAAAGAGAMDVEVDREEEG